jgi:hypothetical protein
VKRRRASLFSGYWRDESGEKGPRVSRPELAEAWRLWARHRDVREGRAEGMRP